MKTVIQVTTNLQTKRTSYGIQIGVQSFRLSYEYDSTDDDTAADNSMWYSEQLKIALSNAGCKEIEIEEVEIVSTPLQ